MSEILRHLGMHDDENYIYLDKDGKAQKRVEITVHWEPVPTKRILVTCNATDSLSYLRYLIGEVMEKYSTFSGLTSIQANNLTCNKISIPDIGYIGDFIKSGDHLTCDISSLDIWLDVKIEAEEPSLVIFLEIKIHKNQLIGALKKNLLEIANQIFHSRSSSTVYDENEAEIKKMQLVYVDNNLTTESRSVLNQNSLRNEAIFDLDENLTIEHEFDYLDRYVYSKLTKKRQEENKISFITTPSCTLSESILNISTSAPVRNLRVEPQVRNSKFNSPYSENYKNSYSHQKRCPCILL
ncbi:hypothetical protein SteCoe_693 [Stentor coeruleus]|uniref:Uncharacterized protein n=1 Tax=Stentor coeruleus TaxID=5963 RepID=A0A1R2D3K1_9CILI|nr:hypothetical protein SteCoe_693 [Stentor coeruleus]